VRPRCPPLRPWRELNVPRRDVIEGRVQESEFAADLHRVSVGQAPEEYQDAARFFERTYITEELSEGFDDTTQRTVSENCRTLTFLSTGFEKS